MKNELGREIRETGGAETGPAGETLCAESLARTFADCEDFSLRHIRRLVMPAAPRAATHLTPARGRGRAVGAAQIAPTRRTGGAAGEGSGQPRRTAGGAGEGSSPSARAAAPAYELTDGRRIPLLCTPATASHRLAAAAYAQSRMFGIPLW
ncbi:MAG: hypothetical protein II093_04005 [Selenomonas sp.]|nr:hypothetical protein [Selenomonas sp.]